MDIQNQVDQQSQQPIIPQTNPGNVASNKKAIIGLILGVIGLVAWFIPIIGAPIIIVGLVFSVKGLKTTKRKMAITALILCIIGLVLTIANASIGAYLGATGQHPLVNGILNEEQADYSNSFKETFKNNYLSGCVSENSKMSEFCSCTYDVLLEKLGFDGFIKQSQNYTETKKMSPELLDGISSCIDLMPQE